jgi:hypothetical protein
LSDSDMPASGTIAAMPIFDAADGTAFSNTTSTTANWFQTNIPPSAGPGQPPPKQPDQILGQWHYGTLFNGNPVVVQTLLRDPRAVVDSSNSFVNMSTLWVRRRHGTTDSSGNPSPLSTDSRDGVALADWVQNLPGNLAKLFDLPRRFLDLFRDEQGVFVALPLVNGNGKADPIASYRLVHAILRALSDVLALGIWGSNADQTTGRSGLARTTVLAMYGLASKTPPATGGPSTMDQVISALWKQDAIVRTTFANSTEDWIKLPARTNDFCDALAARIGASLGLRAKGEDFISALVAAVGAPVTPAAQPGARRHRPPIPDRPTSKFLTASSPWRPIRPRRQASTSIFGVYGSWGRPWRHPCRWTSARLRASWDCRTRRVGKSQASRSPAAAFEMPARARSRTSRCCRPTY